MTDSFIEHVQHIKKLPSIPAIAQEVLRLTSDDTTPIRSMEEIIKKDPSISAKILSVANSSLFGSVSPTTTISDAIIRIGFTNVKNIAVGIALMTVLDDGHQDHMVYYQRIFKHSAMTGVVARLVAKQLGLGISEEILINGLLHDMGLMIQNRYFFDKFMKVMTDFDGNGSLLDTEKDVFGFSHLDVGAWLIKTWGLPETVFDSTLYHHEPSLAKRSFEHVALVHIADYLTNKHILSVSKYDPGYPFDISSLETLGISENDFEEIEEKIKNEAEAGTDSDSMFN